MKNPYSKLPWSAHEDQRAGWVNSDDGHIVVEHTWKSSQRRILDLDYLVEACNNYPIAVKLFKNILHHNGFLKEEYEISPSLIQEITNFLKEKANETTK